LVGFCCRGEEEEEEEEEEGEPSNLCSRSMGLSLFRQYATAYTIGPRTGPRPASSTPRITSPLGSSWMDLGIGEW